MINFFKKYKDYSITIAIVFAIVILLYSIWGIFPFGDNSIAHYDMSAQTIPLSELVYDFLQGKSPLFYTTLTGMGANTFGYLAYFILSPFNILALFGGAGNVVCMVNIIMLLKLMLIAYVICWFIKKYFNTLPTIAIIMLSILYTFSGYMLFSYTYISFLDYLIYAPLLIHAFILMQNGGKKWPLILMISLMILSCFSLGCFILLYLMVAFIGYIFICVEKDKRKELIFKTLSAILMAIGVMSWLLVPSLLQYLLSSRKTGIPLWTKEGTGIYTKMGVALTEIVSICLGIMYLIKCDKKNKFNKFMIFCCGITLLTIISDEVIRMFNGGSIYGYYSRFGMWGALLTLVLACLYIRDNGYKHSTPVGKGKSDIIRVVLTYLVSACFIAVFIVIGVIGWPYMKLIVPSQQLEGTSFASYLIMLFCFVFVFIFIYGFKLKIGKNFYIILLICSLVSSGMFGAMHIISAPIDISAFRQSGEVVAELQGEGRVKLKTGEVIDNNAITFGLSSINTFSSMVDGRVTTLGKDFGYSSGSNSIQSNGGTILSDMVVGNKYIVSSLPISYPYVKLLKHDKYYIYENIYAIDGAFLLPNQLQLSDDIVDNQQKIFEALGGHGELLEKIEPTFDMQGLEYYEDNNIIKIASAEDGVLTITNEIPSNKILYGCIVGDSEEGYLLSENDIALYAGFFEIDNMCRNFKVQMTIDLDNIEFYLLDLDKLSNLNVQAFEINEGYGKMNINISDTIGSTLVVPYVDIDNYSIMVNGKEQRTTGQFSTFITLDLTAGENVIEIKYNSPVWKHILIGLVIGLLLCVVAWLLYKFRNLFNTKFINVAFIVFACVYGLVMLLYPMGVTILGVLGIL